MAVRSAEDCQYLLLSFSSVFVKALSIHDQCKCLDGGFSRSRIEKKKNDEDQEKQE